MTLFYRFYIDLLVLISTSVTLYSQASPMNQINQLVPGLVTKNAASSDSAIEEHTVKSSAEFVQLRTLCSANWSDILDNLDSVVSGDEGKIVVLSAFENLTASNYMTSVERVAEKYRQNQISKKVIRSVLMPKGRMRAFLSDNYQHARVQTLLNDLKTRLAGDSTIIDFIDEILSGAHKADLDEFREAHAGTADGNIPQVPLQP